MALEEELIIAVLGPRGGGKSMDLCFLAQLAHASGKRVVSNMPIWFDDETGRTEAESLDWAALFGFDESYFGAFIVVDELPDYLDSRLSTSTGNRVFNLVTTQVRKHDMSFAYSAQSGSWVDKRMRFQIDVRVDCKDLKHSPWGRENGLRRGEVCLTRYFDESGVITGVQFKDSQRSIGVRLLNGKRLWKLFDTRKRVAMDEAFRKWRVDAPEQHIRFRDSGGCDVSGLKIPTVVAALAPEDRLAYVSETIGQLRDQGHKEITNRTITDLLRDNGVELHPSLVGQTVSRLGYPKKEGTKGMTYLISQALEGKNEFSV